MTTAKNSKARLVFMISGCVMLLCFYHVFVGPRTSFLSDSSIRIIHVPITVLCFISSIMLWADTKGSGFTVSRGLALLAMSLSSLRLLFLLYIRFGLLAIIVVSFGLWGYLTFTKKQPESPKKDSTNDAA